MPEAELLRISQTRFELRPHDGQPPIRGDVRVPEGPRLRSAVVLCHGFKGFREWGYFPHLARALAARGHAAVSFDFSRNGVGDDGRDFSALYRFAEQTHSRNVEEIRMVLDAVLGGALVPGVQRVGLWGHSRGGGEAVLAVGQDARIQALVTWAAIASVHRWTEAQIRAWRRGETVTIQNARTGQDMPVGPAYWRDVEAHTDQLDIRAAAARVAVPWLLVHGDADATVPPTDAESLLEMAGPGAELVRVPGGDHTFGGTHPHPGTVPTPLATAAAATLNWFDQHLR